MSLVQCRSDFCYAQRPQRIYWAGVWQNVTRLTAEWKTPDGHIFRVLTDANIVFELIFQEINDNWQIKFAGEENK
jgi:hypothetical protein